MQPRLSSLPALTLAGQSKQTLAEGGMSDDGWCVHAGLRCKDRAPGGLVWHAGGARERRAGHERQVPGATQETDGG